MLYISKKGNVTTDNSWVLYMINKIPHKGQYKIQTKFDIPDWLFPTGEFNIVLSVDQDTYCLDF